MALKVELKPHERIIIGACVVTNTDQRARLLIEGDKIPILREKDILTPETADTPAKLIYLGFLFSVAAVAAYALAKLLNIVGMPVVISYQNTMPV